MSPCLHLVPKPKHTQLPQRFPVALVSPQVAKSSLKTSKLSTVTWPILKGKVAIPMRLCSIPSLNIHIFGARRHFSSFALKLPLLGATRSLERPAFTFKVLHPFL